MATASAGPSSSAGTVAAPPVAPQWRQFTFFDVDTVKDSQDLASSPRVLRDLHPPTIIASTSGNSPLKPSIIVSSGNTISVLDRHFNVERAFTAWDSGRGTAVVEAGGLLVGIGEEDGSRFPVLKIWDLTREEKKRAGGGPILMRNVKIQHGQRPHPISCVAITSNLSHLAIGLGDGTVLLYRHILQSLTTSPAALTSLPKARVIHESNEPITGLGFREPGNAIAKAPESANVNLINLFIVTTNRVLCASTSAKGGDARTIDELGSGLGCAVMDWDRREMIVARDEAIYLYGPEGRGPCYAYEGPKSSIAVFRNNLIIVSPPFYPTAGSNSATVRNYVKSSSGSDSSDIAKVTVFDLSNKMISYSGTFREGVRDVFYQWGSIFVLGSNGALSRLDEHPTTSKLDVLYRRNLYTLAVSLATSAGIGDAGISDIHRRYGDYLYGKGDFDAAMSQFVKTLGYLQPSYVIRKFLDGQRIHNLTTYLQELHSRGLANPDHTTLLLNCYTKTADKSRLDAFIKSESSRSGDLDQLPFDLDTAIRVCRQAGFFEHATYLAKRYGKHEEYLRIQIEDAEEWDDALQYLRSLGAVSCQENLVRYGRTLLNRQPEATTDLLIELCSGTLGKTPTHTHPDTEKEKGANGSTGPAMLSYLGYNRVTGFLNRDSQPSSSSDPQRTSSQSNGFATTDDRASTPRPEQNGVTTSKSVPDQSTEKPSYTPPSPRQYFAHFLDHPALFIHFLESVAEALWNQVVTPPSSTQRTTPLALRDTTSTSLPADPVSIDQRAVWNTLLELYLTTTKSADQAIAAASRSKAQSLLAADLPFDPMQALILCSLAGFTEGLVGLWESMGMYEDVLRYWMDRDAHDQTQAPTSSSSLDDGTSSTPPIPIPSEEVIRYLNIYGPSNPHLYPLVLRYLTSSPQILSRHPQHLSSILETIDQERIMPPLAVVQLLSRNGVASVGSVKDWLRQKVADTRDEIDADKSLVQSYRSETATKQKDIADLTNVSQPEVFQVTRCASCGMQLDLPSVHFMCKHSYHQRCLSDSEPECLLCARQHSIIREVRRNQTRLADRHDLFINEVHEAEDGFAVVAGAFGRGVMGKKVEVA